MLYLVRYEISVGGIRAGQKTKRWAEIDVSSDELAIKSASKKFSSSWRKIISILRVDKTSEVWKNES